MTNPATTATTAASETAARTAVWPTLTFRDARAMSTFLVEAFGFRLTALYARDNDPSIIEHAEMRWPLGGGIMFGSAGKNDSPFGERATGNDSVYLVCDDPDALFDRAKTAGAEVIRALRDEDYGSRGFVVRDPEGNLWSFGTYWGE
ncbi:VOC family protein [Nocardia sp. NPDC049149]|uniref:VOC family protein n=1 Tax=Nocardia sp. NPDC049149 TaxID=3364315 RepID=UPI003724983F